MDRRILFGVLTLAFSSIVCFAVDEAFLIDLKSLPWQGEMIPTQVVDEATGTLCLEYSERNPQREAVIYLEFPDPDLDQYDALEFDWKLASADASVVVSIEGYPENGFRRYYLRKRPNPPGHWQRAFLSLRQDDDGAIFELEDAVKRGNLRLSFAVSLRDLEGLEDPQIIFRFAEPRLVRYPVKMEGDWGAVTTFEESGRIGQRYPLTLHNQTKTRQSVHLAADTQRLGDFDLRWPAHAIELGAGEQRTIHVEIFIDDEKAGQLPPLSFGEASLFAWTEQHPELITTWFDSYFINRIIGVIPPETKPAPWFASTEQRERALQKIANLPEAQNLFQRMRDEAHGWLDKNITLPELFFGYSGHYTCRAHSSPLQYRGPGVHWCVNGEHFVEGNEVVDRAGDFRQHESLTQAALLLARFGWLTGEKQYSKKAAEILLAYAEKYHTLPLYHEESTGFHSRIAHSVLGECWWFDPVPRTFDLIRGSGVLSKKEENQIVEGLILSAVVGIRSHRVNANQQAEINHAVGMGALVAEHWPLAAAALDGEMGIRFQWSEDFDSDGMSAERELPYHFAAVKPFAQLAKAYEELGVKVFDPTFKRLFEAPIAYAPDQLVGSYAGLYESALATWEDPAFARQVAHHRARNWDWESLLSPVGQIEAKTTGISNSTLEAGGYTTLRQELEDGELLTATVNFGSPAWRGGKALLDPSISWRNLPLNQQIRRIGYGFDGSDFSYTPAAGNSLLVDGRGGSMLRADQDTILETPFPAARWTSPLHRPLFTGVQWSRAIALCGDTVLILDQFAGRKPHRFDLITYLPGAIAETSYPKYEKYPSLLQEGDGYSFYRNARRSVDEVGSLEYVMDSPNKDVLGNTRFLGTASDVFLAEAQAGWHPKWIPVIIRRFEAESGWAASAFTANQASASGEIQLRQLPVSHSNGVALNPEEAIAVEVVASEGRYLVLSTHLSEVLMVDGHSLAGPLGLLFLKSDSQ